MVEGRALSIQDPTSFDDGETNFIMVDRYNILKTSFDEVKCLKNLRKTLEVQFYGEVSCFYCTYFSCELHISYLDNWYVCAG